MRPRSGGPARAVFHLEGRKGMVALRRLHKELSTLVVERIDDNPKSTKIGREHLVKETTRNRGGWEARSCCDEWLLVSRSRRYPRRYDSAITAHTPSSINSSKSCQSGRSTMDSSKEILGKEASLKRPAIAHCSASQTLSDTLGAVRRRDRFIRNTGRFRPSRIPAPSLVMQSLERRPFPNHRAWSADGGSGHPFPCRPAPGRTCA